MFHVLNRGVGRMRLFDTEADFAAHVQQTVQSAPEVAKWHFVVDNLDTHRSETLVRLVAECRTAGRWRLRC